MEARRALRSWLRVCCRPDTAELDEVLQLPQLADLPFIRNGRIHVFDGVGLFARPGPGLADSLEALADLA